MTRLRHQGVSAIRDHGSDRLKGCATPLCVAPGGWATKTAHTAYRPAGYHPSIRLILICRDCGNITPEVSD